MLRPVMFRSLTGFQLRAPKIENQCEHETHEQKVTLEQSKVFVEDLWRALRDIKTSFQGQMLSVKWDFFRKKRDKNIF